jgi:hypothetical protein
MRSDKDNRPVASHILKTAHQVVTTERGNQHGDAENSFKMIGDLWATYLRNTHGQTVIVSAYDVAQMMSLLKIARAVHGDPVNADHYIDAAGYTALAGAIAGVQYAAAAPTPAAPKPTLAQETLQRTGGVIPPQKQDLDLSSVQAIAQAFAPEAK